MDGALHRSLSLDEIIAEKMSHRKREGSSHRSCSCHSMSNNRSNKYQRFPDDQDYSQNYRHYNHQQDFYKYNGANGFRGPQVRWEDWNNYYPEKNMGGKWNHYNHNRKNRINQRPYNTTSVKGILRRHDSQISLASMGSQKSSGSRMSGVSNMSLGNRSNKSYRSNNSWCSRASNCSGRSCYSCNSGTTFQSMKSFGSRNSYGSSRNNYSNENYKGRNNYYNRNNYTYNKGNNGFKKHNNSYNKLSDQKNAGFKCKKMGNSTASESNPSVINLHRSPLNKDLQMKIRQIQDYFTKLSEIKPMLRLNTNPADCKLDPQATGISMYQRIDGYYQPPE